MVTGMPMDARDLNARLRGLARILRCCRPTVLMWMVLTVLWLFSTPASTQSASFRSVDTNGDGVLTFNELAAAFGSDGANRLLRSTDYNGDGRITIFELRRGPGDDDRDNDQRPGSSADRDDDRADDRDDGDDGGDDDGDDD